MTDSSDRAVLLEKRGELAWITLNRPQKLNSINDEVREQLPQALTDAEADEALFQNALRSSLSCEAGSNVGFI